jgi:NAD(P)-dependent dehydrogenase (short-subunit alcohol dehydrogenase family)
MDHVIAIETAVTGVDPAKIRAGYEKQVSMQTFIDPEEIAHMILFLASPLGKHISGQVISVDGHTETMRT